jgi:hypothetical protein
LLLPVAALTFFFFFHKKATRMKMLIGCSRWCGIISNRTPSTICRT